jgi:NADH dehydrogenase [ubiquinone] 1 alpha subcomplex assembly factor 7
MTVAEYMAEALGHPQHGYYRQGDPFGAAGDFTTAPEISQIFGELLGAWCAHTWQTMSAPHPVRLVELGPGRGTLMADALRATRKVAGFHAAIDLHLVEIGVRLRQRQAATLRQAGAEIPRPTWHDGFATVPEGPLLLVANEFFDALPIHQFESRGGRWLERAVAPDELGGFAFVLRPPGPMASLVGANAALVPAGTVVEVCPEALAIAGAIGRRVAANGGAALVIDYGHEGGRTGESLQAVRRHGAHDPLSDPGAADLSAQVDFGLLGRAAREAGARTYGPTAQNALLKRLGIHLRAAALLRHATPAQADDIRAATDRLLRLEQMGTLFKALAISAPGLPTPAGFEESETT